MWTQAIVYMREDEPEPSVGVMGDGSGNGRKTLWGFVADDEGGAMEGGMAVAVAVAAVCLRRRAWSLRRAAAERLPLRTIERSLCAKCSLAWSFG